MVRCYIALGSNVGDRARHLRDARHMFMAYHAMEMVAVSPVYETPALLPADASAGWDQAYLNQVVAVETSLQPLALLEVLKTIEAYIGRQARGYWGPREIDCDLLLYGEESVQSETLTIPHAQMLKRRFVLEPLSAIAPDIRILGQSIAHWLGMVQDQPVKRLDSTAQLVGILNYTPDSFSDGGDYGILDKALARIEPLVQAGAAVIDVGAESTRPGAVSLTAEEEWARLSGLLEAIRHHYPSRTWRLSLDSYHPETQRKALAYRVDWLNDVRGLTDPAMLEAARESEQDIVIMHSLGIPPSAERVVDDKVPIVPYIHAWADATCERLERSGIDAKRIILDPGIGFGKTMRQSLALIEAADELVAGRKDVRWLYGHSRKSFMRILGAESMEARHALTVAYSRQLAASGVHYLRVHDVSAHLIP